MMNQNPDKSTNFTYSAFISYRRLAFDTKWAKWLMEKLETYRTPKESVNDGVPPRVRKLFRDDDEIPASADLRNQLEENLKASEFLIVVCSPDTPKSDYVRQEIAFFKSLGRGDKIIPFLIAGEPEESYPPELFYISKTQISENTEIETLISEINPIAADVRPRADESRKETKYRAFIRIAATLLGCKYDELVQRELKRQRKRRRIKFIFFLLAFISCIYLWDYNRIKTNYFYAYTTQYGVPKGLGEISKSEAEKMHVTYALTYQRHKLISMIRQTGAKKAIAFEAEYDVEPWLIGVDKWDFNYGSNGLLTRIVLSNQESKIEVIQEFSFISKKNKIISATVNFELKNDQGATSELNINSAYYFPFYQERSSHVISRHQLFFDNYGYITQRNFLNNHSLITVDDLGTVGRGYSYNASGSVYSVSFLGIDQEEKVIPQCLKNGVCAIVYDLNNHHQITKIGLFDETKHLARGSQEGLLSFALQLSKFDKNGNEIERAFFDENTVPVSIDNCHKHTVEIDVRGNIIKEDCFDIESKPALNSDNISSRTLLYDSEKNVIQEEYFGVDGRPTLNSDGYAKVIQQFNYMNKVTERSYFGIDNNPILNSDGFSKVTNKYDSKGNEIEQAHWGINGQLTLNPANYAKIIKQYNVQDKVTEASYFGVNGKPILNSEGYAKGFNRYNQYGSILESRYFDIYGKPTINLKGYASVTIEYDLNNNEIETAFFGVDGKPILNKNGYAKVTKIYDAQNELTSESYFGTKGDPILNKLGYAKSSYLHDKYGNLTEEAYFDTFGKLTQLILENFAKRTQIFDRNRLLSQTTFDAQDNMTNCIYGYARVMNFYSENGTLTGGVYFDQNLRILDFDQISHEIIQKKNINRLL